jgi:hypothetical protein
MQNGFRSDEFGIVIPEAFLIWNPDRMPLNLEKKEVVHEKHEIHERYHNIICITVPPVR